MILGIQTADATARVWLSDGASVDPKPRLEWESGRALSEELLTKLQEVVAGSGISFQELTGIIIFSGPGSFTSLRIGHTVANALAASLEIPIAGVQGDDWLKIGVERLKSAKVGDIALPYYGGEAHITRPKG